MDDSQNKVILILILVISVFLVYQFVWVPNAGLDNLNNKDQEEENQQEVLDFTIVNEEITNGDSILLDVRSAVEREENGYALNSVHFELSLLTNGELPTFSKEARVYVYGSSIEDGALAEAILEGNGFISVNNIGSLTNWRAAGGEVVGP